MKTDLTGIFRNVKSQFCNLIDYKIRGNTIEIITAVTTLSNHYVSVFISKEGEKFVISDGGWVDRDYYNDIHVPGEEDINVRVEDQIRLHYGIKIATHKDGTVYNYKSTDDEDLIALMVFEVSNFISLLSNNQSISYLEEKSIAERKKFSTEVNGFLKQAFGGDLELNDSLSVDNEELNNVKFNAIIRKPSQTYLVMYVTGYHTRNFIGSASEAIVNFQLSNKYTSAKNFSKTAIINNQANGFNPYKVNDYLQELTNITNHKLIEFYDDRDSIFKLIPQRAY
ncbi:hypothetical protein [Dyadobacter sp. 3J3]|uniref:hypothetical protein n=1 Tax=Dyadobacter sp. 3J3 TaxID=2606600 RepID=UPI00135CD16F|nr:hypothetical protein [Dyadobacter sp. 3J3]